MKRSMRQRLGDWYDVLLRDPCVYCGGQAEVPDHIVPRSRGGTHGWENVAPACRQCNGSKGPRSLLSFVGYQRSGVAEILAAAVAERAAWAGVGT